MYSEKIKSSRLNLLPILAVETIHASGDIHHDLNPTFRYQRRKRYYNHGKKATGIPYTSFESFPESSRCSTSRSLRRRAGCLAAGTRASRPPARRRSECRQALRCSDSSAKHAPRRFHGCISSGEDIINLLYDTGLVYLGSFAELSDDRSQLINLSLHAAFKTIVNVVLVLIPKVIAQSAMVRINIIPGNVTFPSEISLSRFSKAVYNEVIFYDTSLSVTTN